METAYGLPFPPRARREVLRLAERLALVERQIAHLEAERDAVVRRGEALPVSPVLPVSVAPEGGDAQAAARIAVLTR